MAALQRAFSGGAPTARRSQDRSAATRAVSTSQTATTTIPLPPGIKSIPAEVEPLFRPIKVGRLELTNRLVYPPLTRNRAIDNLPRPHMATYYEQRSFPGSLMIAEATIISKEGQGYPHTPGIWSQEQVEAWKPIVKAVHDKGAHFYCQIWHCGRASHQVFQPNGQDPVSSSPVAITSEAYKNVWTGSEMAPHPVPQALTKEGIKQRVAEFAAAAKNAIEAGFDGIEIHGANGYLVDQFTKDGVNKRTDEYGGSIENRCRFALEVVKACVDAIGADRVAIRLSPFTDFLDATDSTPYATFMYLVEQLNKYGLAYLHMVEGRVTGNDDKGITQDTLDPFRKVFKGPFIASGGYKKESAVQAITSGHADLVAIGRWWLANPDLPQRFILDAPLNKYDRSTFYTHDPVKGYIDYPTLDLEGARAN